MGIGLLYSRSVGCQCSRWLFHGSNFHPYPSNLKQLVSGLGLDLILGLRIGSGWNGIMVRVWLLSVSHLDTNISKSGILAENLASYLCICTLPRPLMCFCKPMKTQINSCVFTVQTMIEFVVLYCDNKTWNSKHVVNWHLDFTSSKQYRCVCHRIPMQSLTTSTIWLSCVLYNIT